MHFVTNLGDLFLIVPLSLLLSYSLWTYETKEAAYAFITPFICCLLALLAFKLFFLSCGDNLIFHVASPSGHTATSTFVFGSIGLVIATHVPRWGRIPILLAMSLLVTAIAASRIYVGAHSLPEVVIAFVVGACMFLLFAVPYRRLQHPRMDIGMLVLTLIVVTTLMYGLQSPAESIIRKWAGLIKTQTSECTVAMSKKSTSIRAFTE